MFDPPVLVAIALVFVVAGLVKGVIGLGLPTISLGVMTALFDLTTAMALMVVPSFATNLWQAGQGGGGGEILRRLWPFFLVATGTVWIGALALPRVDSAFLSALLGLLLAVYGLSGLAGFRPSFPVARERGFGVLFGLLNGLATGMTGSFVVPGVMYLQAIGLSRDRLVQAMGILFTLSTLALAASLHGHGLTSVGLNAVSIAALVPAVAGMWLGQRVRHRLPEARFRRLFFTAVALLGAAIVLRAILA